MLTAAEMKKEWRMSDITWELTLAAGLPQHDGMFDLEECQKWWAEDWCDEMDKLICTVKMGVQADGFRFVDGVLHSPEFIEAHRNELEACHKENITNMVYTEFFTWKKGDEKNGLHD